MPWQKGKRMKRILSHRWRVAAGSMLVVVIAVGFLSAVTAPASAALTRSDVAVAHNADGRLVMFFVDQAQRVWQRWQTTTSSQSWGPWSRFDDNRPFRSIAAETNGAGRIEVFGIDLEGDVYRKRQLSQNANTWSGWEIMNPNKKGLGHLSVTRGPQGGMIVFGIFGGDIWGTTQYTATTWSPWGRIPDENLPDRSLVLIDVAAETNTSGRMELFTVSHRGTAYRATEVSPGTGTFSSWQSLGKDDLLSIAVTKGPWGGMVVFGTDGPGGIWGTVQLTATTWSPWGQVPGTLTKVAADINVDQRLTLVGVHDGELGRAHTNLELGVNVGTYSGWLKSNVPGSFPTSSPPRTTTAPPPPPSGFRRVFLGNCDIGQHPVQFWLRDATAGQDFVGKDIIDWQGGAGGGCPAAGSAFPQLTFSGAAGHLYVLVGTDRLRSLCNSHTHNPHEGGCIVSTTTFTYQANGQTLLNIAGLPLQVQP
jgi:hypothetical protein